MNQTKGVNRLFLAMAAISIASPYLLGSFFNGLTIYQSLAVSQFIFFAPVLIYLLCTRGRVLEDLQVRMLTVPQLLRVLLLAVLLLPVMTWLNLVSMLFVENYVSATFSEAGQASLGLNVMYIALIPAVSEEFMFRGVFYHGYRKAGILKGALVSGLCFGLIHLNLNQFCYAFVLGVIFAVLVEITGSIYSSMIVHFCVNFSSVWSLSLQNELSEAAGGSAAATVSDAVLRSSILSILGMYTVIALIFGTLAILVMRSLARSCGRSEHMRAVFAGAAAEEDGQISYASEADNDPERDRTETTENFGQHSEVKETHESETVEGFGQKSSEMDEYEKAFRRQRRERDRRRIVTPSLIAAVALCLGYMVIFEVML